MFDYCIRTTPIKPDGAYHLVVEIDNNVVFEGDCSTHIKAATLAESIIQTEYKKRGLRDVQGN